MAMLKKGTSGKPVKILQEKLGVDADGVFGPGTDAALRKYQEDNALAVDGIAGPDTFAQMGLHALILLRRGSKGETVKKVQDALGTGADGIFGGGTEKAVKDFQEKNGLKVDGLVGPATLAKMNIFKDEITEDTIKMSKADPQAADASQSGSVWDTVKGWFN